MQAIFPNCVPSNISPNMSLSSDPNTPEVMALPQSAVEWLNEKKGIQEALATLIQRRAWATLAEGEFTESGFSISLLSAERLLVVWHAEYLQANAEESWAFIRLEPPIGLLSHSILTPMALKRAIQLASRRLKGLLLDSEWEGRRHQGAGNTVIVGMRTDAFRQHLGYAESEIQTGVNSRSRAITIVGPESRWEDVSGAATEGTVVSERLYRSCEALLKGTGRKRKLISDEAPPFNLLRSLLRPTMSHQVPFENVTLSTSRSSFTEGDIDRTRSWSYDDWIRSDALSIVQRRILEKNAVREHPVRIIGPAGSGKTLLMQLLAMRQLTGTVPDVRPSVLYITHNSAMADSVRKRFDDLGAAEFLETTNARGQRYLDVKTLTEYALDKLSDIEGGNLISRDAESAKQWQIEQVESSLDFIGRAYPQAVSMSALLSRALGGEGTRRVFSRLVLAEISNTIKGHGLVNDRERYVSSPTALSRFHRTLSEKEREFIFSVFERYQKVLRGEHEAVDPDDIALDLLSKLRTSGWDVNRKRRGYDFVFVDEAQLFNENERRIFPLLTKGQTRLAPIALALDEAQELFGQRAAGFGALGLAEIEVETLPFNHRSSREIVDLAFFVIEKTTDLFGVEFPNFSNFVEMSDLKSSGTRPYVYRTAGVTGGIAQSVIALCADMRQRHDTIAVVCHGDRYFGIVDEALKAIAGLQVQFLLERGRQAHGKKHVVFTRPEYVGGQEFDAVIIVGLEEGVVPPRIVDNEALSAALEQQSLRELYLSVTRARCEVAFPIDEWASPSVVLQDAVTEKLVVGT
ncbi:MAG: UvrD-helicase domain-containing protein [Candidatus Eremiobacteraeota bacterium]|nr:UvrD-helicase domain-containing protein [Candidatus Eremiobacteraeota bacterium]